MRGREKDPFNRYLSVPETDTYASRPDDGRLRPNRLIVCQNVKVIQRQEYKINNVDGFNITQYEIVTSDDLCIIVSRLLYYIMIITMIM